MVRGDWSSIGAALLLAGAAVAFTAAPVSASVPSIAAWDLRGSLGLAPVDAAPARPEPFGFASDTAGPFADKWRELARQIEVDRATLARCRQDPAACSEPAGRFGALVEAARLASGRARLGLVNRTVNLAIAYRSDMSRFGIDDVWSPPLATFAAREGDCEDYAIAKYLVLREAGTDPDDLRLAVVRETRTGGLHAMLMVRADAEWIVLNNVGMALVSDAEANRYAPVAILGAPDPAENVVASATPEADPQG